MTEPDWRPIDTAPRDDRRVLMFVPGLARPIRIGVVIWGHDAVINQPEPTHWMPLPSPPNSANK